MSLPTKNLMLQPNKNIKIFFNYVLGPLLGAWLFYSLYKQIEAQPHLHQSLLMIKQAPFGNQAWKFWLVIVLAFVNWGLEGKKWQLLMKNLEPLTFWIAFKSVLSGVTLSLNTPNRIGEYGGRILYLQEGNRIKSISLSIAGSITQLIVTLLIGSGGLLFLINTNNAENQIMGLSIYWIKLLLFISLSTTCSLLFFLFRLSWFIKLLEKIPGLYKYIKYITVLDEFTPRLLLRLLLLSLFRYLVFVIQYIFLLQVLQVQTGWVPGFWIISVLYLVLAIVPSFAIADLGIRGKFSVELLHLYSANTIGIIGATFGIWFINLFIPGLAGSIFIMGKRIFKER